MPTLGIVIPVYNEEAVLPRLCERLQRVLDGLDLAGVVCFVDDGSRDRSLERLQAVAEADQRFQYLSFSRNFGHQTAVLAGLRELDADVYVVMDADLQDPPELVPELVARWREGCEVVYCVRQKRKENFLKRWAYAAFYRLLQAVSYVRIPLDSGDFCLMDRIVVDHLRQMPEHNAFIRGLRTWVGFRQAPYPYERDARADGEPKYTLRKLFGLAYDGLISFSFAPLRLATKVGFGVSFTALVATVGLIFTKLVYGIPLQGWTSTVVLILFMGGINLLTLGVMGEYLARIFDEVKGRPLYVIREQRLACRPPLDPPAEHERSAAPAAGQFVPDERPVAAAAVSAREVVTTTS
jgi:polyisoprenyl-phosphate glycosyltransferase